MTEVSFCKNKTEIISERIFKQMPSLWIMQSKPMIELPFLNKPQYSAVYFMPACGIIFFPVDYLIE